MILPFAFIAIYLSVKQKIKEQVKSMATAILLFECVVVLITNILSIARALNGIGIFLAWLTVFFVAVFVYVKNGGNFHSDGISFVRFWDENKKSPIWILMVCVIGILFLILLFGAVFTVPHNYDSMSYHLARIGYWIDHRSVDHYICNIDRQIYSPVLAEYNLLHIMLLSGNDTFVNFLQYFSMFGTAYFLYHSARKLGTNTLFSFMAVFAFVTMPLTVSQSITTQNDLFAALFFALFIYLLLEVILWDAIILDVKQSWTIFMLSLTVGFAYLAKTSVCASMLFFMPWLLLVCVRRKDHWSKLLGSVAIAVAGIGITVAETWIRTYQSGGSIMMDTASGDIMVATKNVSYIIVNILKNFSLLITQHLWRPLNGFVYRIAIGMGRILQVEVNNEAIAFHGFDFLHHMNMGDDMYSQDKAPSAFVAYMAVFTGILLIVLSIRLLINRKKLPENIKKQWGLSAGFCVSAWLSLGFIMALLRWQPWGTRLMYPALVITIVATVNMLWLFLEKKQRIANIILLFMICLSTILVIPSVSYNMEPALRFVKNGCQERMSYYFSYNQRKDSYEQLMTLAKQEQVKDIGLIISGDGYDYPLWLMFHQGYEQGKLRHIIKENANMPAETAPDAILMVQRDWLALGDTFEYAGETYTCIYVDGDSGDAYLSRIK